VLPSKSILGRKRRKQAKEAGQDLCRSHAVAFQGISAGVYNSLVLTTLKPKAANGTLTRAFRQKTAQYVTVGRGFLSIKFGR
jgi:hypothetical protein